MAFFSAVQAFLPDLLIIALGALLAGLVGGRFGSSFWQGVDWLIYYVFFPALLFLAASGRPISPGDLGGVGAMAWSVLLTGMVLGWSIRRLGPGNWVDFAGCWQTCWRFNTALGFVAIQALPGGARPILATIVGLSVPLANALAVLVLARGRSRGIGPLLIQLVTNPFLLASVAGITVALTGINIPPLATAFLGRLSDAALPLMLLVLGASLDWRGLFAVTPYLTGVHLIRLAILPGLVVLAHALLGPTGLDRWLGGGLTWAVLLVFAALPTGPASLTLAMAYGASRPLVAGLVTQSQILALISLPLWIGLARGWA